MERNVLILRLQKCGVAFLLTAFLSVAPGLAPSARAHALMTAPGRGPSWPEGRIGTWDFFVPLTYNPSSGWAGPGGSSINLDPAVGFGFGAGYNFSNYFQLNGLFGWSARDYTAKVINSDLSERQYGNTLYRSTFSLNAVFYFPKGYFTPFLSGGVGATYLDTNIQAGPGTTVCWWDPWNGYVCNSTASTRTETDLSYSAGAGVRLDLSPRFSLQPGYNKAWINIRNAPGTPNFDIYRLDLIFRMP